MDTVFLNRQHEKFRLSAILYADNNYEVSPQTIHRKIIESVLLERGNSDTSIAGIILFAQENYGILLTEQEVEDVFSNAKDSFFENCVANNTVYYRLTNKRKVVLNSKVENNIGAFIREYEELFNVDAQDVVHRYLYELFQRDISTFHHLFKLKKQDKEPIQVDSNNFSEGDKIIVNNFLNWDNQAKNKAVFDLSSLALEYCILTNQKNGLSFVNLRNKQFFLDANVIYRAIGINGDERKILTKTFLSKFHQVGEKLLISEATDREFRDSIRFHIDNIRKHNTHKVSSQLYMEVCVNDEIFSYYHKWRARRVNANTDLFLAEVISEYKKLIDQFDIIVETKYPYDKELDDIKDRLKQLASDIYKYKGESTGHGSAWVDAENICWVETKRDGRSNSINETVYFLISTDQQLRLWDYRRKDAVPVVMLPSQWLSILLRYVERSNDDYKSFVSFLNLKSNDAAIDGEKLQIVLEGISEISTNIETQKYLVAILVENRFRDVIDGVKTSDELLEKSKQFAKTEADKLIEDIGTDKKLLETDRESLREEIVKREAENRLLKDANDKNTDNEKSELSVAIGKYNKLIKDMRDKYVRRKILMWRILPAILFVLSSYVLISLLCVICGADIPNNFLVVLFSVTDNIKSETLRYFCHAMYISGCIGLLSLTLRLIKKRFAESYTIKYKNKLELKFDSKRLSNK